MQNKSSVSGNAVHWRSRRQQRLALSSNEAEYYAAAEAAKDAVYIGRLSKSIAHDQTVCNIPQMFLDSKTAKQCAENPCDNEKQRHISLRAHFIRELVSNKDLEIFHIPGADNPADQLTKPLGETKFSQHRAYHKLRPGPGS